MSLEVPSQQQELPAVNGNQLVIDVHFLLERYHGAEWPPSPRRLFLALVAALYQSPSGRFDVAEAGRALEYLERQRPPRIEARGTKGQEYTLFVPNNDMDVISKDYARHGMSQRDPRAYTTSKKMTPYIASAVRYSWALAPDDGGNGRAAARLLCSLAREVPVLGLGIDPVAVNGVLSDSVPPLAGAQKYLPDDDGGGGTGQAELKIDVPLAGMLGDAKRRHAEFLEQVTAKGFVKQGPITHQASWRYRKGGTPKVNLVTFMLSDTESKRFVPHTAVVDLAARLHDMCGPELGCASLVVMPSIGHQNSDAMVRRVGVIIPPSMGVPERDRLLARIDSKFVEAGGIRFQLVTSPDNDSVARRYVHRSTVWRSVTPLDPGGAAGSAGDKRSAASSILGELANRGLKNSVMSIRLDKIPDWDGLEKIGRDSSLWYAEIEFRSPVSGPLLLGSDTRRGNGLLAPALLPEVAYYKVVGSCPPVERTVKVAGAVRAAVMSQAGRLYRGGRLPQSLSGHDDAGKPLRTGHAHAFWLPVDNDGDGLIDHIVVYAKYGLEPSTRRAFQATTDVRDRHTSVVRIRFDGFHRAADMGKRCVLFKESKIWTTATPYYTSWHTKKNFGVLEQIEKELNENHHYRNAVRVEHEAGAVIRVGSHHMQARAFDAARHGKARPHGAASRVKISFGAPFRGPLLLGNNSHFGLGIFVPSPAKPKSDTKRARP